MASDKPPPGRPLTDRELLALPDRGPPRERFGDRYFWPLIALLGLGIFLLQWFFELPIELPLFGPALVVIGLGGWVRERWKG